MRDFRPLILPALALLLSNFCFAQTSTTQLSGTVYDNTQATVGGAIVTVQNESTGITLKQITNQAGLYAFAALQPGSWTVVVEMVGFKTARRTGIILTVGTPQTADITIEIGDTREVVRVEASAEALQTSSATLGNVVSRQAVSTLPLNGRNPLNLMTLEPGVTQRGGTAVNVNGLRAMSGNVTIDGIEANESSNPTPTNNVFRITPDSVEEFKVTTSNATPEEGRNAGMSVSIATRSGTNEFHGSAIEYFRNTKLNSAEYFANAQGNPRPEVKANQYGFEVGGPIRKNQTFFFGSWQGQKVNLTGAIDKAFGKIPNVYTPEALAGIYRYVVVDQRNPLTVNGTRITQNSPALVSSNGQLAGGIRNCASPTDMNCIASYNIFANDPMRIGGDPTVLKTLGGYPAPNSYATGDGLNVAGYLWNTPAWIRGFRNLVRVDHTFNASNNIFFRAMWAEEQQLKGDFINSRPQVFPGYPPRSEVFRPAKNYAFSWRTVISPSLVNEFTAGFARFTFVFTQGAANPLYPNIPAFTFNNVDVDYQNTPTSQRTLNTPQFIDNLTYIRGAHVMKLGTNMRFYQQNNATGSAGGGSVAPAISLSASTRPPGANFNLPAVGSSSGAGIASADNTRLLSAINDLLGIPAQIQQSFLGNLNTNSMLPSISDDGFSLWVVGIRAKQYNFFAQDEWKMRKNLTLTYGFRWEINTAPTATGDRVMVPDKPIDESQGTVTFVKAGRYYDNNNIGAIGLRVGITWSPQGNTVVRAGYGIAFDPITTYQASAVANSVPGQNYTCTAAVGGTPTTGCPGVPDVRISQGFPNSLNPPTVQPSSFLSPPLQLSNRAPSTVVFDPKLRMQTVQQWNVTIQRELPGGFVAQAGYVGNRGLRFV